MKRLKPGDVAPPIETITLDGAPIHVPSGSWTLLSFLRYASCPMCNLRVRELTQATAELESRQVRWIVVFHSSAERLTRHFTGDARQHIVADPRKKLFAKYRAERSWLGMLISVLAPSFYWRFLRAAAFGYWGGAIDSSFHSMPADFLISPDGRITLAHYGTHIGDHLAVAAVRPNGLAKTLVQPINVA